jgi:hypothetical protein
MAAREIQYGLPMDLQWFAAKGKTRVAEAEKEAKCGGLREIG